LIAEAQFVSWGIDVPWYGQVGAVLLAVAIIFSIGRNPLAKRTAETKRD
jgi:hypothetical protein